jgi:hypothetical protein
MVMVHYAQVMVDSKHYLPAVLDDCHVVLVPVDREWRVWGRVTKFAACLQ